MECWVGNVHEKLKRCVERLGGPYRHDGQDDPMPFLPLDSPEETRSDNNNRRCSVNPRVVLGQDHCPDPAECILEASNPTRELERSLHLPLVERYFQVRS
jgi:hypothetical protein